MKHKYQAILENIYHHPQSGSVKWTDMESFLVSLGAITKEREGSRVKITLFGEEKVFHKPHPSPDMAKAAVADIRNWLEKNDIRPGSHPTLL
jgi:hypothetical protein